MRWRGVVIHHTVGRTTASAADIEEVHKKRGFKTIGYHYLVRYDEVAARWLVEDGRSERMAGAHCPGANNTHLGVAVAGDYREREIQPAALSALVMLLTKLCSEHHIDPSDIIPHCDRRPTECPGARIVAEMPSIRERVRALLPYAETI
jgi:N-acetylmuramoyl-L-alanine amidase CwlA